MAVLRRLVAAALAIVVVSFPLALERCRTVWVSAAAPATASAPHACDDMAAEEEGPTVAGAPLACSHSDDARLSEATGLAPSKLRGQMLVAAAPAMVSMHIAESMEDSGPPRAVLTPQSFPVSRSLPLRL